MKHIRSARPGIRTDDQPQPTATSAMAQVFHELDADGQHALCEVCGA
jgi:hypothetical protein